MISQDYNVHPTVHEVQQRAFEKHVQEKIDENARREYMNSQNYRDWVLKKAAENRLNQDEALENE